MRETKTLMCLASRTLRATLLVGTVSLIPTRAALAQQRARPSRDASRTTSYYPGATDAWEHRSPRQLGLDSTRLAEAVAFAISSESNMPRNLEEAHYQTFGREPYGEAVGPFKTRGDPTGVILRNGYIVAEWGDPQRVGHNRTITWDNMLRQVSDWEGTLWGKPEWAHRPSANPAEWRTRARVTPGSVYEYNDVRVNALALAALEVWRRPLPQVLREYIMDPIGASNTWRWIGYESSWMLMDGQPVQSMAGGGHWGGGMFISARDMARFGLLTLRHGKWKDRQLISEEWVRMALTPTPAQPTYGFMNWFLNTDRKLLPSAPASAFVHVGNGTNIIYCDPELDIVAVVRWIENNAQDGFVKRLVAAFDER